MTEARQHRRPRQNPAFTTPASLRPATPFAPRRADTRALACLSPELRRQTRVWRDLRVSDHWGAVDPQSFGARYFGEPETVATALA